MNKTEDIVLDKCWSLIASNLSLSSHLDIHHIIAYCVYGEFSVIITLGYLSSKRNLLETNVMDGKSRELDPKLNCLMSGNVLEM